MSGQKLMAREIDHFAQFRALFGCAKINGARIPQMSF